MKTGVIVSLFVFLSGIMSVWYAQNQSIRLDESQSLWIATKPVSSILQLTAQDVHVPLYSLLLHFWLQIWGNNIISARILSVIFFIMTIPVLLRLAQKLSNQRVAITTVALFCLSPFVLWYANEARMYTLFAFITTLNQYYFLVLMDNKWTKGKFEWWLTIVIGLYTHYFFSLLMVTQFVYLIWQYWYEIKNQFAFSRQFFNSQVVRRILLFCMLVSLGLLAFVPWFSYFISQGFASGTKPLLPPPTSYSVLELFVNFVFGFPGQFVQAVIISLWPLLLGVMFFIFSGYKSIKLRHLQYFFLTVVLSLLIVFWASFVRPLFLSRYMIFVIPSTFILVASILEIIKPPWRNWTTGLMLATMLFMAYFQNSSQTTTVREDYRGVNTYLSQEVTGQDLVVVSPPFTIYPIEYNYLGQARIVTLPEWDRFSQAMPGFDSGQMIEQLQNYEGIYQRVFFVFSYDQGYQDEIAAYLDNNYALLEEVEFLPAILVRSYQFSY